MPMIQAILVASLMAPPAVDAILLLKFVFKMVEVELVLLVIAPPKSALLVSKRESVITVAAL